MNVIEKNLAKPIRENMRTLIAGALGLFLALRYNDFIGKMIVRYIPETSSALVETLILFALTVIIVFAIILVEKGLDGK